MAWYLILQLFGSNSFALELQYQLADECEAIGEITVVRRSDSVSIAKRNYLERVTYGAEKRKVPFEVKEQNFFNCINQSEADLVLLDEQGLWGAYALSREGVDLILTELDVLLLQKSYGKGAER